MSEQGRHPDEGIVDMEPGAGQVPAPAARRHKWRSRSKRALITDASHTAEHNRQSRERQYAILQGLRIPFILLAIFAAWKNYWVLASILFVVSVPLPWIAVVRGNAVGEVRDSRTRNVYKPAAAREQQRMEAQRRRELGGAAGEPGEPGGAGGEHSPVIIDADNHGPH